MQEPINIVSYRPIFIPSIVVGLVTTLIVVMAAVAYCRMRNIKNKDERGYAKFSSQEQREAVLELPLMAIPAEPSAIPGPGQLPTLPLSGTDGNSFFLLIRL